MGIEARVGKAASKSVAPNSLTSNDARWRQWKPWRGYSMDGFDVPPRVPAGDALFMASIGDTPWRAADGAVHFVCMEWRYTDSVSPLRNNKSSQDHEYNQF
jgi:hypothetical protein